MKTITERAMEVEIEHVELGFINELNKNICGLQVEGNLMCFALRTGSLFLIDLDTPSNVIRCQIPLVRDGGVNAEKVLKIWLNPSRSLILVKTNFAKYYLCDVDVIVKTNGESMTQNAIASVKQLSKKNCDVRSVAWVRNAKATGMHDKFNLLIGTARGQVYYIEINSKLSEQNATLLYESPDSIDGIYWNDANGDIIIASKNKLIYWDGLQSSSNNNKNDREISPKITLSKKRKSNEVEEYEHMHMEYTNKFAVYKNSFAWVMESGIVFSNVEQVKKSNKKVLGSSKVILNVELPNSKKPIRDIMLSDYHILILRESSITIVNQLDNSVIYNQSIWSNDNEHILGFASDVHFKQATFWCFSASNIFEIILKKESNSVWRLLCDQQRYDDALNLQDLSLFEQSSIQYLKGMHLLEENVYSDAAKCFGKSDTVSIPEIALKLLDGDDGMLKIGEQKLNALQFFLSEKLLNYRHKDSLKYTIILDWIMWNYVRLFCLIDEKACSEREPERLKYWDQRKEEISSSVKKLIDDNINLLERGTFYQLLEKSGRRIELLYLAEKLNDHQYLMNYWIRNENWYESLKVLQKAKDPQLAYKHANILLVNCSQSTINTWMTMENLNPVFLIDAILTYFSIYQKSTKGSKVLQENYALTYLKWYVGNNDVNDKIIYNTIVYMMITTPIIQEGNDAMQTDHNNDNDVIEFMENYSSKSHLEFVLRLSLKFERIKVAIYLLKLSDQYEDAVDLALSNGLVDEAKEIANMESLAKDFTTKRKLWIKIAQVVLSQHLEKPDIKQNIRSIIRESEGTVKINDLLPFFNEFTTVANLKDELVRSLEEHNHEIITIRDKIKHSLELKKDIIHETEKFKERYRILEPGKSCDQCQKMLQTRKFLVFPCGHCFHTDCLIRAILSSNDYNLKGKIENFQKRLNKDRKSVNPKELEELMATKCCLCSDIAINKIDEATIDDKERSQWVI